MFCYNTSIPFNESQVPYDDMSCFMNYNVIYYRNAMVLVDVIHVTLTNHVHVYLVSLDLTAFVLHLLPVSVIRPLKDV